MGHEKKMSQIQKIREDTKKNFEKIPEIIGSHSVSCEQKLFVMYLDKCKPFLWKFHIKSNSNKHIHISRVYLLDEHLPEYYLHSVSINNVSSSLEDSCQLWENSYQNKLISLQIVAHFYSENYGNFEQHLVCEFENGDIVLKHIGVQVSYESKLMSSLYFRPVKDVENELVWIEKYKITPFDGEPEISLKTIKYPLPPNIEDLVCYGAFDNLGSKLSKENYKERLHLLLHIEEFQRRSEIHKLSLEIDDIQKYIHPPVPGIHRHRILKLPSDQFQTEQACQLIGKSGKALMKVTNLRNHNVQLFELLLEKILSDEYVLEMSLKLDGYLSQCKDPLKTSICFRFVDVFQYMHRAIDNVYLSDVFPKHPTVKSSVWSSFKHSGLSKDQSIAYNEMMNPRPGPPVLVLGPFGSGKTRTLATAILELLKEVQSGKANHKILICTHSNSAADHYIEDFIDPFLNTANVKDNILIRVNWELRYTASVSRTVLKYCEVRNGKFVQPSKDEIEKYNVVVCTLVTADILFQANVSRDHFSHIFIDEAAQAMEVEAIIPLTLKGQKTKVILAGDHLQLGFYLSSPTAKQLGLGISLLERLFQEYPISSMFKLKLLENYRSFKDIVEISSAMFYEGALLSNIERPAGIGYPLKFYGVHGKESLSMYHPSYYNLAEVDEILSRIEELRRDWPKQLGKLDATKICVLCCFSAQIQEIRLVLRRNGLSAVRVENVTNVQGLEFDVVILSTVRSYPTLSLQKTSQQTDMGFLSNPKLLNTAITRAKYQCIFIGEPVALCSFGTCKACWKTVLASCQSQGEFHYRLSFESVMEISFKLGQTVRTDDDVRERTESLKTVLEEEQSIGVSPGVNKPMKSSFYGSSFADNKSVTNGKLEGLATSSNQGTVIPSEINHAVSDKSQTSTNLTNNLPNFPIAVVSPLSSATSHSAVTPIIPQVFPSNPPPQTLVIPHQQAPRLQTHHQAILRPMQPIFVGQNPLPGYCWPKTANLNFNPLPNIAASGPQLGQIGPLHLLNAARVEYETSKSYVREFVEYLLIKLSLNTFEMQNYLLSLEQLDARSTNFLIGLPHFDAAYAIQALSEYKRLYIDIMNNFVTALLKLLPEQTGDTASTGKQQCDGAYNEMLHLKLLLECQINQRKEIIITRYNMSKYNHISIQLDKLYSRVLFLLNEIVTNIRPHVQGTDHAADLSTSAKIRLMCCIKLKFISCHIETVKTEASDLETLIGEAKHEQFQKSASFSSSVSSIDQELINQFLDASDSESVSSLDLALRSPSSSSSGYSNVVEAERMRIPASPGNTAGRPVELPGTAQQPHPTSDPKRSYSQVVVSKSTANPLRNSQQFSSFQDAQQKISPACATRQRITASQSADKHLADQDEKMSDTVQETISNLLSLTDEDSTGKLDCEVEDITGLIRSLRSTDSDVDEWFIDRGSDPFVKEYIASFERHLAARLPSPATGGETQSKMQSWIVEYRMIPRYKPYASVGQNGTAYGEGIINFERSSLHERPIGVVLYRNQQIYFVGLRAINRALTGDKVRFEITGLNSYRCCHQGQVIKVLERGGWSVLCKASLTEQNLMVPSDERGPPIIVADMPEDDINRHAVRYNVQKFIVKVLGWPFDVKYPVGKIEESVRN